MTDIEYRTLPEYQGYRFGSDGSIWSCWKKRGARLPTRGSESYMAEPWRQVNPITNGDGYLIVNLRKTEGTIKRNLLVHRLILVAFGHSKPDGNYEVCHCNGVKTDNRLCNLRWDTRQGNALDMIHHGTLYRGSNQPKLTEADFEALKDMLRQNITRKQMSSRLGASIATIKRAVRRIRTDDRN